MDLVSGVGVGSWLADLVDGLGFWFCCLGTVLVLDVSAGFLFPGGRLRALKDLTDDSLEIDDDLDTLKLRIDSLSDSDAVLDFLLDGLVGLSSEFVLDRFFLNRLILSSDVALARSARDSGATFMAFCIMGTVFRLSLDWLRWRYPEADWTDRLADSEDDLIKVVILEGIISC